MHDEHFFQKCSCTQLKLAKSSHQRRLGLGTSMNFFSNFASLNFCGHRATNFFKNSRFIYEHRFHFLNCVRGDRDENMGPLQLIFRRTNVTFQAKKQISVAYQLRSCTDITWEMSQVCFFHVSGK
jgi:hypothetical protein